MTASNRLQQLREQATVASDEILALDASQWPDAGDQTRLSAVLAYAQSVLDSTDPDLITDSNATELEEALSKISNNPADTPASAVSDGDRILEGVARLPVARDREAEQAAKDSAATFQRSAQQRLASLRGEFGGARSELRKIEEAIQARKDELASTIDERRSEIATKIESLQAEFAEKHPVAETFAGKLALSLILGGIATYAARQSSYHRRREHHARDLQLELTAFSPFIEPLAADQQEEERVIMTRKTFGKTTAAPAPDEEPGPTPLSFALRRKEKAIEEE